MLNLQNENLITSRALGSLIDLTSERVRQLEDEGLFTSVTKSGKKYYDLAPSVLAYIDYLKERSSSDPEDRDLVKAKAQADLRWKQARAGKAELELAELKGQMHRSEDVEMLTCDMISRLRSMVLALPGRLAVDTANATTAMETSAIIKKVIDDLLNDMADYKYNPADYRKLVNEREKWLSLKEQTEEAKARTKQPTTKTTQMKSTTRKPAKASTSTKKPSKRQKT